MTAPATPRLAPKLAPKLASAFSLNMLALPAVGGTVSIKVEAIAPEQVSADAESIVGHEDTACVLTHLLGRPVPCSRVSVTLTPADTLYVAQYTGPRLPAGATALPAGARFTFARVTFS